ncbi:hypothetical protein CO058_03050 [candidate division WWE3 bacterium CG_4_9_14_0_2_um_filter_35_11]|uniref:Peptidase S11 D-alanyl-D-alanine carboxypeptidase A N-terminal domain-containing protein n=1 Tax=candidate division WWE3 bacterium CG_4_9_14_0_2_um_filter_35_11 TaxID=1975077 RepID=A0A2M8ELG9_UNCKA|nr:MAG: hypothetical protein COV25_01980 [candidate division WWE3 bacterium CG10_big_fil_rev_8_21_14_0_10_35_32]PJC23560.1 MAG: hypothetical protein CO058_03050 [candidate division WWE3 bacterium CG_4_9_14_0_2_um_filter_35_11]
MPSLYSKIKKTLDSKKINYNELRHEAVFTSEEAAKIRGGNPEEGAKALIFSGKRSGQNEKIFLQLVIQGTKRVDKEKFKARFGFENLKMASSEDVEKVSGVKPGAVAPFGNLFEPEVQVFVEAGIIRTNEIEFNAGDHKISIRMNTGDWVKIVKPTLGKFAEKEVKEQRKISEEIKMLPAPKEQPETKHRFKRNKITAHKYVYSFLVATLMVASFTAGNLTKGQEKIPTQIIVDQNPPEVLGISDAAANTIDENPRYKIEPPEVSAKAYGIFDMKNDSTIYTKNPDLPLPPASVTKVMTAMVAMDEYDLEKPVYIPAKCTNINASKVGFVARDVLSLEDVLYGLLVRSGADAACALANLYNETDFIDKMNQKANEIGMEKTIFENPIGLDSDKIQLSTVNDLEKLTKYSLKYGVFRKIVGTKEVKLVSLTNTNRTYKIKNTNDLLFTIPGTVGVKTGFTTGARECLIYLYEDKSSQYLIIVLGSEDRFGDTTKLINWTKESLR